MRVRFLILLGCCALSMASISAVAEDMSARVSALQFDQSAMRNSVDYQIREQNARLDARLAKAQAEQIVLEQTIERLQRQSQMQFAFFSLLFVVAIAGAWGIPFYLARRRQADVHEQHENIARHLKTTRELLEQMRGDFKAIQGKMREYRSEFDLRVAELRLHEFEVRRSVMGLQVAPLSSTTDSDQEPLPEVAAAEPVEESVSDAADETLALWQDEADSYRALCVAEPEELAHRDKLVEILLQAFAENADPGLASEAYQHVLKLIACQPEESKYHAQAGQLMLALTGLSEDKLEQAEQHLLDAERLQRGIAAYELVALYAQSGRAEEARKRLALARLSGDVRVADAALLRADPKLTSLRDLPWFQSYLESLDDDLALA